MLERGIQQIHHFTSFIDLLLIIRAVEVEGFEWYACHRDELELQDHARPPAMTCCCLGLQEKPGAGVDRLDYLTDQV